MGNGYFFGAPIALVTKKTIKAIIKVCFNNIFFVFIEFPIILFISIINGAMSVFTLGLKFKRRSHIAIEAVSSLLFKNSIRN